MRQALFRMADRLDVLIFGASGFTGKYTVYEAVSVLDNLKWGIAGRNKNKLEEVLKEMGAKAKTNLSHIPIVTADVGDQKSLVEMAKKCKVLVNCCGPYRFIGEPVVKACIEAGTHHVDVSGENQFMESMQLKYHKMAEEKGIYVISACGFDSIPTEMGINFIEKNFDGVVNSVETYLTTGSKRKRGPGAAIHYGTWESLVHALANASEMEEIRAKLFTTKMPRFQPHLKIRPLMFKSDVVKGVCLPFPGPDRSVAMRSQRFLYETEKKRPVQIHAYITFPSYISAFFVAMFGLFFGLMTKFSLGRHLLLKYPRVCTLGFVSHEGPSEATMEAVTFKMTMKAEGWPKSEKLAEPTDQFTDPPSKTLMVRVSGSNPGYGATCVALLSSAKTILKDSDKMPGKGGVIPPGAAFAKTSLISELEKHERGLKFEILANK